MCYKEESCNGKTPTTFIIDNEEELEFDEKTFLDETLDDEEKCHYFIMCKKDTKDIPLLTIACSYFWNIKDSFYDAAVCFFGNYEIYTCRNYRRNVWIRRNREENINKSMRC